MATTVPGVTSSNAARGRLEGKVAIITGGASGIGEASVRVFVQNGAKVMIADIQDEKALKMCEDLGHNNTSFIHCDVTKEIDMENLVNSTISKFGKLDIMFNNAGIVEESKPTILENDLSEFKKTIDVNLIGAFLGTKHAARVMIHNRRGIIINTASTSSIIGGGSTHAYTSSKFAVLGLTKNTAVELGRHGIRVNCVSPYILATPLSLGFLNMTEEQNPGFFSNLEGVRLLPKDIGEAALYLASDESRYVSGHNLMVDGGFTCFNGKFCIFDKD